VKLVMTLLARNEADIIDAQLAFHLHAGVDYVIATDNRSDDGTTEILERYQRAGLLHLIREEGDDMRQEEWVTRMARLAATDFGADWVINSDADEFWWPRGGTLKDVLGLVPERFGVVRGCWRHFLPRPGGDADFAERMTVRLCTPAAPGDKSTIYHAHQKVAHRADPEVRVESGNHNAIGPRLEPVRQWHPIEVLHFSLRSAAQVARKARGGWLRNPVVEHEEHQLRLDRAVRAQDASSFLDGYMVSDDDLELGLAAGTLAVDTRLRDALRALRSADGTYRLPAPAPLLSFAAPDVHDAAAYAAEVSVLAQIEGIVRAEQRVAALEARLMSLRTLPRR
jgi:hypothetical protein